MNLNKPKKLSSRNRNAKKVILAVTAVSVVIAVFWDMSKLIRQKYS